MILRFLFICVFFLKSIFVLSQTFVSVFSQKEMGYSCFRIPAIVRTLNGTLLAFAEGRKQNCGDSGNIDLVLKRSLDNGKTWSKLIVLWDDGENTCGNPAPVVDRITGKIVVVMTWNLGIDNESQIINSKSIDTRRVFLSSSESDGLNWDKPSEITNQIKLPNWKWYATGPCNGIQIQTGVYKGRIIIPCNHSEEKNKKYYSHTISSDDGGMTWGLGGSVPNEDTNECTVVELPNNKLLLNMRYYGKERYRQKSISNDGGLTWSAIQSDKFLIEPICQGSIIKIGKFLIAFSNPESQSKREFLTVKLSINHGESWKYKFLIYEGPSAYSNLITLPNGKLGCLFEMGKSNPYESISFKEINYESFIKI